MVYAAYKSLLRFFSAVGINLLGSYVAPLKETLAKSNLAIVFELYVGRMLLFATLGFSAVFGAVTAALWALSFPLPLAALSGLIAGITAGFGVLTTFHAYPYHLLTSKRSNIDGNLPFAINHMAAVASSGVPPFVVFKILTTVPEYGEVMNESKRVVRNVEVFGMDLVSAMRNVAQRTPSDQYKQFLSGIIATTETGGDLKKYLEISAKDAMFEYRLKRDKYLQTLSTYADFYTAVLIAAPLFFISVLSVMALIGGSIGGLSIQQTMTLGIYLLIPLLNTMFLMFIHFTQPSV